MKKIRLSFKKGMKKLGNINKRGETNLSRGTIIYIGGFELPDKNAAAHRVLANGRILKKNGYKVVYVGINRQQTNKEIIHDVNLLNEDEGDDAWLLPYPYSVRDQLSSLFSIKDVFKIVEKYDDVKAIIAYNYNAIALLRLRMKFSNNIKIISDCTEWYSIGSGSIPYKAIKRLDTWFRMEISNKKVDGLILASTYLLHKYKDKKCVVIPTLSNKKPQLQIQMNENPVTEIVYAGIPFIPGVKLKKREHSKDRLDLAISLLHKAHCAGLNFKFYIYGLNRQDYLKAIPDDYELLEELEEKIFFKGFENNDTIRNAISRADFTILIRDINRTTMSGFPTKVTESINCGTPVITTPTSDLKDYISHSVNGFYVNNENDIIEILSLEKSKVKEMKENCLSNNPFELDKWTGKIQKFLNYTLRGEE